MDNDPRLTLWLTTRENPVADAALGELLAEAAFPSVQAIVRRKFSGDGPDAEDLASEVHLQLFRHLHRLRENFQQGVTISALDLPAYAAAISYATWANHLRRRYPQRETLLNRLRYLLENHAGPQGFALWQVTGGERLAGFLGWRQESRVSAPTPRQRWLLTDARAAATDAFGGAMNIPTDLAALTAGLLVWLGGPLELRDLTRVLAELLGMEAPIQASEYEAEGLPSAVPDSRPSPHDALRWKEYLGWLWCEVLELPLRQRTAFLCHSSLLREMEICGLTSIRAAAAALEIPAERMAKIWSRLPLNDLDIAAFIGGGSHRQQVINLRKVARVTLGEAWQKLLDA